MMAVIYRGTLSTPMPTLGESKKLLYDTPDNNYLNKWGNETWNVSGLTRAIKIDLLLLL